MNLALKPLSLLKFPGPSTPPPPSTPAPQEFPIPSVVQVWTFSETTYATSVENCYFLKKMMRLTSKKLRYFQELVINGTPHIFLRWLIVLSRSLYWNIDSNKGIFKKEHLKTTPNNPEEISQDSKRLHLKKLWHSNTGRRMILSQIITKTLSKPLLPNLNDLQLDECSTWAMQIIS